MTYALITGGAGFIGSFIARNVIEESVVDKAVVLDHFGRYTDSLRPDFSDYRRQRFEGLKDRIVVQRGDAKYYSILSSIFERYRPLYVFHMAALPLAKLPNLNSEEAREGCVDSTGFMLEVIGQLQARSDYRVKQFVYASSSLVYGDFQGSVATEDHPTAPKDLYGTMKLAGEVVTRGLGEFFQVPFAIVRPSAVYGPTDMNRRVTQIFLENAFLGERLQVQGSREALDFTYIKDVARGFVLVAIREEAAGEVFNITYGKAHTLMDYVNCLRKHFPNLDCEVTERDQFRPVRGTLSIDKARRLLGYEPRYSLQKGVDEYVAFVKKHNRDLASRVNEAG